MYGEGCVFGETPLDVVGAREDSQEAQGRNHSSIFLWRLFKLLCNLTPALNQMALSVAADARALDRIEQYRSAWRTTFEDSR